MGGMGKRKATSEPLVRELNEPTDLKFSWPVDQRASVNPTVPAVSPRQVVATVNPPSLELATSTGVGRHVGFEGVTSGSGKATSRLPGPGHLGTEGVTADRLGTCPTPVGGEAAGPLEPIPAAAEEGEDPVAERFWELLRIAGYDVW